MKYDKLSRSCDDKSKEKNRIISDYVTAMTQPHSIVAPQYF